jgi:mannose-6-phosphate isomerase-like protein (cupin superfamily)
MSVEPLFGPLARVYSGEEMPVQEFAPVVSLGAEGERYAFGGYEVIFKSPNAGAPDAWTAADYILPSRQMGAPLHYHQELSESFYVITGELWLRVGDREVTAGPGSYIWVPPGTAHAFANRSDSEVRFLAHASGPQHKDFLCRLIAIAQAGQEWPPRDPSSIIELGKRYDTYYLIG